MSRSGFAALGIVLVLAGVVVGRLTADRPQPRPEPAATRDPAVVDPAADVGDRDALVARVVEINDANQSWLYTDADQLAADLVDLTTSAAHDRIAALVTDQVDELRSRFHGAAPAWWVSRTLAVRIVEHDPAAGIARAEAWAVQILSQQRAIDPASSWKLTTYELVWERDAWRVESFQDEPGPSPAPSPTAWHPDAATLDAHLNEFALIAADGGPQFPTTVTEHGS